MSLGVTLRCRQKYRHLQMALLGLSQKGELGGGLNVGARHCYLAHATSHVLGLALAPLSTIYWAKTQPHHAFV